MTTQAKEAVGQLTPETEKFFLAEYHEAAASYANGVEIGFRTNRGFFALNFILFTIQKTPPDIVNNSQIVSYFQTFAPLVGFVASLLYAPFVWLYFKHLDNCLDRCCEIESMFGGQLFTRNRGVPGKILSTTTALYFFSVVAFVGWGYQLFLNWFS